MIEIICNLHRKTFERRNKDKHEPQIYITLERDIDGRYRAICADTSIKKAYIAYDGETSAEKIIDRTSVHPLGQCRCCGSREILYVKGNNICRKCGSIFRWNPDTFESEVLFFGGAEK